MEADTTRRYPFRTAGIVQRLHTPKDLPSVGSCTLVIGLVLFFLNSEMNSKFACVMVPFVAKLPVCHQRT